MPEYTAKNVILQDMYGNYLVPFTGAVKTVNDISPDSTGNVNIDISGLQGPQGPQGEAATISAVSATIDNNVGIPSVSVNLGGTSTDRTFTFNFKNLKGNTGEQGAAGATGATGPQGPEGPTGASIVDAEIDENTNHLIVTLADTFNDDVVYTKGDTGPQGPLGYSIVASVTRNDFTESLWDTYGTTGHTETWPSTENIRNICRINDLFYIIGTSTDTGYGHLLVYRSTTSSGDLTGTCLSHQITKSGTFTPSIDSNGILSWSNDVGASNPSNVDLYTSIVNLVSTDIESAKVKLVRY